MAETGYDASKDTPDLYGETQVTALTLKYIGVELDCVYNVRMLA